MAEQQLDAEKKKCIEVKKLDGESVSVSLRAEDTVGELRKLIQQKKDFCVPSLTFHLFLRGSKLKSENSIQSLGLKEHEFIILAPYVKKTEMTSIAYRNDSDSLDNFRCNDEHVSSKTEFEVAKGNDITTFQEANRNPQEGRVAMNYADSIWDMIAADLPLWQATIDKDVNISDVKKDLKRELKKRHLNQSEGYSMEEAITKHTRDGARKLKKVKKSWIVPSVLERYYRIFQSLNLVYGFLQKKHIQATWKNMKTAVQNLYGDVEQEISISDIEILALLFPKLLQISSRVGEGESESFNLDLLDPSNIPEEDIPRSLHEVMPINLQQGIGPSDFMPSLGAAEIPESLIKSLVHRRLSAFESSVTTLMEHFQEEVLKGKKSCNEGDFTLDDLLQFVSKSLNSNVKELGMELHDVPLPRPPRLHKKLIRCMDTTEFSAAEMVEHLKLGFGSLGQMVHCEVIKQQEAEYGQLLIPLSDPTVAALQRLHISKFYTHQAEAINAAIGKQNVIIATSTSSGKSICYNVPVLEHLLANSESCALYLFPTKALAQDQFRVLLEMTSALDSTITIGVYDGDSPQYQRLHLRDNARLLITNPDMLHMSILPSHKQFERILSNLRYVIVDEAHAYRGAFGCHTSLILRRLRRLCCHLHGVEPTFIVSSATVANPREHAMELIGLKSIQVVDEDGSPRELNLSDCVKLSYTIEQSKELIGLKSIQVVDEDGSPRGLKYFLLWDPPLYYTSKEPRKAQDNAQKNKYKKGREKQLYPKRSSPILEVSSLLSEMVQHNLRCISFCNTRKLSELILNYTRETLKETSPKLIDSIRAYRAGYTAHDRRNIEGELFSGKLRAVSATNALELGVDIGSIDATIHLGFPGTIASLWQQAGRAGRREKPSLSIYVAFGGPLDQYFMKHPQKLFSRAIEHAQIDSSNPQVLDEHLGCAALEYPLDVRYDTDFFGSGLQTSMMRLVEKGILGREPRSHATNDSLYYIGQERSPAQSVSIRAIDPEKYTIINQATNKVIEEVEDGKAFFEVYEGAVYINQGRTYLVKKLDLAAKVAVCQEADVKYYTKTRDMTDVHILGGQFAYPRAVVNHKSLPTTAQASICRVTTQWIGFRRIWQGTNETFDSVELFLPSYSYESQAAWIRVPHTVKEDLEKKELPFRAGIHAASHALLNVIPLYILCNSSDLGTECAHPHDTRYFPERLLVFDRHRGGIGISAQAQLLFAELLQAALDLILSCECAFDEGCPCCVQYFTCSEYNEVLNKPSAIAILKGVIDYEDVYRRQKISCRDVPKE